MQQPEEEHFTKSSITVNLIQKIIPYLIGLVRAEALVELAEVILALKRSGTDLLREIIPLWALSRGVLALAVTGCHYTGQL